MLYRINNYIKILFISNKKKIILCLLYYLKVINGKNMKILFEITMHKDKNLICMKKIIFVN